MNYKLFLLLCPLVLAGCTATASPAVPEPKCDVANASGTMQQLYVAKADCMQLKVKLIKEANDLYENKLDSDLDKAKANISLLDKKLEDLDKKINAQLPRTFR